jgi:hypothetical protein
MIVLPLLQHVTMPPAATDGGARRAAPSPVCARAHRGRQLPCPGDATVGAGAVSACRTPFLNFSLCFHLAEFKYITDSAYICMNSPIYVKYP